MGKLPSELKRPREWRTHADPFAEDWPGIASRLSEAPELEAKALFEDLLRRHPDRYEEGQLRTFQRRVKQWRAQEGPPRDVFFPQRHRPGEAMQTDFTWATKLGVTICGEPYAHQLCHSVLPYSNWESATVCQSESMSALRRGVQRAIFVLGRSPDYHQTDNSTAATHDLRTGKRGFNEDYEALMRHLGMTPRTIVVGEKHQNGDVEALNGVLKRRLKQHLLLRGSRGFSSVQEYEQWIWRTLELANRPRSRRLQEELSAMTVVRVERLPEYCEEEVVVTSWSTIRVKRNTYSVPSRLRGERLRVRVYDERLEVYCGGQHQLSMERLRGDGGHRIDYRHLIWSLVRKPGAFARYRYREELFPSAVFRQAYDALGSRLKPWKADLEYLRVLHLAASTLESEVEMALELLLSSGELPDSDQVKELVKPEKPSVPEVTVPGVDLTSYDGLLTESLEENG